MAEDKQQATAQAANPNVMNINESKTLFSNPKVDITIFLREKTQRTQSQKNLCLIESKLLRQCITGQTQQQSAILNLPLETKQLTG